jgi:parallel beta-helix repeat protein
MAYRKRNILGQGNIERDAAFLDPLMGVAGSTSLVAKPIHNVKADYGATGDGTTDDSTAILQAIDAANTAGGGVVYFPPGTYLCGSDLNRTGILDIYFLGAGQASILKAANSSGAVPIRLTDSDRIHISSLYFLGLDAQTTQGIRLEDCEDCIVENCTFIDGATGIRLVGSEGDGCKKVRISGNLVKSLTGSGIGIGVVGFNRQVSIVNNIVDGAGEEGISSDRGSATTKPIYCTITGNTVSNTGRSGIGIYRADKCVVSGNTVDQADAGGTSYAGISIATDSAVITCEYISVTGNHVKDTGLNGIRVADALYCSVVGNTINDVNDGPAISIGGQDGSYRCTVGHNTILGMENASNSSVAAGIDVAGASSRNVIIGNTMDVSGGGNTVNYGVSSRSTTDRSVIIGNVVLNAGTYGIQSDGDGDVVHGNSPTGSTGPYNLIGTNTDGILSGSGTPESAVTAPVGTLFKRTDGGAGTTLYVKESGTGNTGWIALETFSDIILSGTGTPEGSVTAAVGAIYQRTDGGAGTTLYVKESGAGNTGWVAMETFSSIILSGTGSPEGSVTAGVGAIYQRTDGGAGTTFYVKESGAGNTGWIAIETHGDTHDSTVYINDSANANMTMGITVNQGANDDEIVSLKSSDVGHGFTSITEADTYGTVSKRVAADGGLTIDGFIGGSSVRGLVLRGQASADNTAKSTVGLAPITLVAYKLSGSGRGSPGADANIVAFRENGVTRFLFDVEGDAHADLNWNGTVWDEFDDVAMVRALDITRGDAGAPGFVRSQFDDWVQYNATDLERAGIIHPEAEDGSRMYSITALQRLHNGAIWQLGTRIQELEDKLANLLTEQSVTDAEKKTPAAETAKET